MRRRQVVLGLGVVATAFLAGCRSAVLMKPERNFEGKPSMEQVRSAVIKALTQRHWSILEEKPGLAIARYRRGETAVATVRVIYDTKHVKVEPVLNETTLIREDGTVHSKYNQWVNNIVVDVKSFVTQAVLLTK